MVTATIFLCVAATMTYYYWQCVAAIGVELTGRAIVDAQRLSGKYFGVPLIIFCSVVFASYLFNEYSDAFYLGGALWAGVLAMVLRRRLPQLRRRS